MRKVIFLLVVSLVCVAAGIAQSPNAIINGRVLDPSGAAIAGAQIVVVNDATGVQYTSKTNGEGIYVVPSLPPGSYRIQVSNSGFKTIIKPDIVLHVQDALAINFTLPIGAASEIVTVQGGATFINTENSAVSTVVDRSYIENVPLNGRSFQGLILLTPGVVTTTPQVGAATGSNGEFSVNGQRTESNYFSVDGVSANIGISTGSAGEAGSSGALPAPTALGTTQGLVSVDALEEFRVQSSTYSAEYGRNPGGQFSFLTRSGTNQWHGTAFEYLRNNVLDANDWFNDYFNKRETSLRQSDFGGTLGGPVEIPHLYNGKDKTFFFFSYEGLRLDQPQAANVTFVPDAYLRTCTPLPLQQVLNAFPQPSNLAPPPPDCTKPDPGQGLTQFIGAWSNPSNIDATSVRWDQTIGSKLRLFFRFANTQSATSNQGTGILGVASLLASTAFTTHTYTFGATSVPSNSVSNEFRLNYSSNAGVFSSTPTNFGGAKAVNLFLLQGVDNGAEVQLRLFFGPGLPIIFQDSHSGQQKQWNVVDSFVLSRGRHQLKFGFDFRRLEPSVNASNPIAAYFYFSAGSVQMNNVDFGFGQSNAPAHPVYSNFSAFAQDEWRLMPRLSLSMGLRWEINPAPGASQGNLPYTATGNSLSTLTLAGQGTPLWNTDWFNFAPRFGVNYVLRSNPGFETVLRGGGGVFFDTGQQRGSSGYGGPGFSAFKPFAGSPTSFPVSPAQVSPAIANPPVAPYGTVFAFPPHLQLPYTLQWNVSIEQALGKPGALTVSYVGSHASRLRLGILARLLACSSTSTNTRRRATSAAVWVRFTCPPICLASCKASSDSIHATSAARAFARATFSLWTLRRCCPMSKEKLAAWLRPLLPVRSLARFFRKTWRSCTAIRTRSPDLARTSPSSPSTAPPLIRAAAIS